MIIKASALAWVVVASSVLGVEPSRAEAGEPAACRQPTSPTTLALEAFGAIAAAYRGRLPGPAGGAALERQVGELVGAYVDFDAFAARALGPVLAELTPEARTLWAKRLAAVIELRYLRRMGSPAGAHLAVRSVTFTCPEARVALAINHRDSRKNKEFEVLAVSIDGTWRAVDVVVDDVSLVALYRGRFVRAYREGGVGGARDYLDAMYTRYAAGGPGSGDD